jgi:hypothetical protein
VLRGQISGLGLLEVFLWFLLLAMIAGVIVDTGHRAGDATVAGLAVIAILSCRRIRSQRAERSNGRDE